MPQSEPGAQVLEVSAPCSPPVLVVAFQTDTSANGGIQSLGEVLIRLRKVSPLIVTQRESEATASWRRAGLEVEIWPDLATGRAGRGAARLAAVARCNARTARLVRRRKIRVVHCNDGRAALSSAFGARAGGAKVVLNVRDTVLQNVRKWQVLLSVSDHLIVLSHEMATEIRARLFVGWGRRRFGTLPVTVSYSVVDSTRLCPLVPARRGVLRQRLGMEVDSWAVVVVGALMPKKCQLELIEYLSAHAEELPQDAQVFFVGDCTPQGDNYSARCVRAVQTSAISGRLHLVGYSSNPGAWYQAADTTLVASRHEGLARAMIESLACATPVVSFACCSAREILETEQCGLVAEQGDYPALLAGLRELSTNAPLAQRLSSNGRAVCKKLFAPNPVVSAHEAVYLNLAKR